MARVIYQRESAFRAAFESCSDCCGLPLARLVFDGDKTTLDRTDITQPAIFAVEYSLTMMLQSWDVTPSVVLGHSIGEFAAACAAGLLTLEEACRAVVERGRLMLECCEPGAMLAIIASERDLHRMLSEHPDVELAVRNGAHSVVVGGPRDVVKEFRTAAARSGMYTQSLSVSHAFHTKLMDPMLGAFASAIRGLGGRPVDDVRFLSSSTGDDVECTNDSYWVQHVRRPVRFVDAVARLGGYSPEVVIEVGPGRTLIALAQRELGKSAAEHWVALLPSRAARVA